MRQRLSLLVLLSCTLCFGQSDLNTPSDPNQPRLDWPTTNSQNRPYDGSRPTRQDQYRQDQYRQDQYFDPFAPTSNAPQSNTQSQDRSSSRIAGPLTTKSEFQAFAEDAAGHQLAVYGRQLFDEVPTTFAPMDRIPVPADYAIGPGDELLIRVWGKVEFQSRALVDRNGQIFIPKVGTLNVAGLRYDQLEGFIHSAIGNLYKDFDLNVTMGQLRSIQVFVLGSARQPGVYTVSSLSTLVNALFASGGPSATGTMRRIQLRRANQVFTELDLYDLLRNGDKSRDVQLLPGDIIYIPPVGPQTAILGSVNEPGIYEIKSDATIASILKDVGGLTSLASVDRALLERVENHRRRQVDEFALDAGGLQRSLKDGDILRVFPISPKFENAVTLRGNVAQPGRYLWHEGMRISDLIPSRDTLLTRDYWYQQNFLASTLPPVPTSSQEGPAREGDTSRQEYLDQQDNPRPRDYPKELYANLTPYQNGIRQQEQIQNNNPIQVHEHWDRPKPKIDTPNRDVMTDVTQASNEVNWEYAAIERRDENDLTTRIIAFNLGNSIDKPASPDNQPLKPGDVVTIFSRKDIPLPQDKHAAFVRVGGEVNAPGVYRISPGETLREIVRLAGGLTAHSYLYASQLTRESTRKAQEEELRLSTIQMQRELSSRYASASSLAPANTTEQQAQLSAQQALITQLSAVHPTGRIVLDMKPDAEAMNDIPDFPLEDGDAYYVPARLGTVQVSGAVYNENAFRYQKGKRLSTYLQAAGGPTRQADIKRIFLIRADGTVVSRQHNNGVWRDSFGGLSLLPGDAIVVPTKLKSPNSFMQQLPFLAQILSQAATTGAVIGTR
jgi:polysaccharide biosynthesis/export protein